MHANLLRHDLLAQAQTATVQAGGAIFKTSLSASSTTTLEWRMTLKLEQSHTPLLPISLQRR